jgi:hypothetical protein
MVVSQEGLYECVSSTNFSRQVTQWSMYWINNYFNKMLQYTKTALYDRKQNVVKVFINLMNSLVPITMTGPYFDYILFAIVKSGFCILQHFLKIVVDPIH